MMRFLSQRKPWSWNPTKPRKHALPQGNLLRHRLSNRDDPLRVGLSGYNAPIGLGYQNREIATHLPIAKWLVLEYPYRPTLDPVGSVPVTYETKGASDEALVRWMKGLDCILFYEQPFHPRLIPLARKLGIAVVCIVNWEWLPPSTPWIGMVDLFVCPNQHTFSILQRWQRIALLETDVAYVPGPVDTDRFAFRKRVRADSFLFVNGKGGCRPYFKRMGRSVQGPARKGLDFVIEAAQLAPHIPIKIRSQRDRLPKLPPNVELLPALKDSRHLYDEGDVGIQPSMFEGTGLQLIEMMAAGLPLITTNAAPMNEVAAMQTVHCRMRTGKVGDYVTEVAYPSSESLAQAMIRTFRRDITAESQAARDFVLRQRSWARGREDLGRLLGLKLPASTEEVPSRLRSETREHCRVSAELAGI